MLLVCYHSAFKENSRGADELVAQWPSNFNNTARYNAFDVEAEWKDVQEYEGGVRWAMPHNPSSPNKFGSLNSVKPGPIVLPARRLCTLGSCKTCT